ncbi:hypothetical protein CBM2592_B90049 [Cupriavidus taiwanensis]|nr:hypothetical protein CBM2592_B90049 [Cupriavidus taiwanensis]SOY97573.1 hypothetical protein CBM2591_B70049 [Cupriavidus taiwanensis]SOZ84271.1 hypothetical protein CBM2618_B100234 [Cupriavidus taiwanensis]SOZ87033.1 hypothetical protein CBM2622_B110234 [Cupriavidus taiwanensis]SOZ93324.1 hypothetical protein CBM2621_B100232 [Cupriavidus taiwanensis]
MSWMSSLSAWNDSSRGSSHIRPKLGLECTRRISMLAGLEARSVARFRSASTPVTSRRYCSPTGVSASPRPWRKNSACPSASSRLPIWWLTADAVRPSSSAARLTLLVRATLSKAMIAFTGGIRMGGRDRARERRGTSIPIAVRNMPGFYFGGPRAPTFRYSVNSLMTACARIA